MKQVVLEFDDEEMELLEEQFKQIQDVAGMETIEDYIYYATMSHCKTMQAASKMFGQSGDIEKLMADENVHVGVVNMPIQLSNVEDKDEFSRYLNDVLNESYTRKTINGHEGGFIQQEGNSTFTYVEESKMIMIMSNNESLISHVIV